MEKFVIVAAPRTGSNMLVQALESHPQITCYGELLLPGKFRKPTWLQGRAEQVLSRLDQRFREDEYRLTNAEEFVAAVFNLSDRPIVGFKLMLNRQHPYHRKLLEDSSFKKIVLGRGNLLAAYSSEKIAKITGQGAARKKGAVQSATVDFDAEEFARFLKQRQVKEEFLAAAMDGAEESNALYIDYLEISSEGGVRKVYQFLGADPNVEIGVSAVKRNSEEILTRFNNPDAVELFLEERGLTRWKFDGPPND